MGSGTVIPSALAVLRFRNSSTFVACCTWQLARLFAFENTGDIDAGETVTIRGAAAIARQAASSGELAALVDRRHGVAECQRGKLFLPRGKKRISGDDEPARSQLDQVGKHSIEVTFGAGIQDVELQPKSTSRVLQAAQTDLGSNRINRVKEESHDARRGYQFAQQLKCLRPHLYVWSRP
jgi:hypothetical protein